MKIKLILLLLITPTLAFADDLWEWAPGHYSYSGENGYHSNGWRWAPGHTTWTDSNGRNH